MNESGSKVGRVNKFKEPTDSDDRTVYVVGIILLSLVVYLCICFKYSFESYNLLKFKKIFYKEFLPPHATVEWVERVFKDCGKVVYVSLPKFKSSGDLKGFAFVEFENFKQAQNACQVVFNFHHCHHHNFIK